MSRRERETTSESDSPMVVDLRYDSETGMFMTPVIKEVENSATDYSEAVVSDSEGSGRHHDGREGGLSVEAIASRIKAESAENPDKSERTKSAMGDVAKAYGLSEESVAPKKKEAVPDHASSNVSTDKSPVNVKRPAQTQQQSSSEKPTGDDKPIAKKSIQTDAKGPDITSRLKPKSTPTTSSSKISERLSPSSANATQETRTASPERKKVSETVHVGISSASMGEKYTKLQKLLYHEYSQFLIQRGVDITKGLTNKQAQDPDILELIARVRDKEKEIRNPNIKNIPGRDKYVVDPDRGLFALAHGDGVTGPAASGLIINRLNELSVSSAENVTSQDVANDMLDTFTKTRWVMSKNRNYDRGIASALAAQIINGDQLVYASAGDNRIGIFRDGSLQWVNTQQLSDIGPSNAIAGNISTHSQAQFGEKSMRLDESGVVKLRAGDRVILASVGIVGSKESTQLSSDLYKWALDIPDPQEAARALYEISREADDSTAIVFDFNPEGFPAADTEASETGDVLKEGANTDKANDHNEFESVSGNLSWPDSDEDEPGNPNSTTGATTTSNAQSAPQPAPTPTPTSASSTSSATTRASSKSMSGAPNPNPLAQNTLTPNSLKKNMSGQLGIDVGVTPDIFNAASMLREEKLEIEEQKKLLDQHRADLESYLGNNGDIATLLELVGKQRVAEEANFNSFEEVDESERSFFKDRKARITAQAEDPTKYEGSIQKIKKDMLKGLKGDEKREVKELLKEISEMSSLAWRESDDVISQRLTEEVAELGGNDATQQKLEELMNIDDDQWNNEIVRRQVAERNAQNDSFAKRRADEVKIFQQVVDKSKGMPRGVADLRFMRYLLQDTAANSPRQARYATAETRLEEATDQIDLINKVDAYLYQNDGLTAQNRPRSYASRKNQLLNSAKGFLKAQHIAELPDSAKISSEQEANSYRHYGKAIPNKLTAQGLVEELDAVDSLASQYSTAAKKLAEIESKRLRVPFTRRSARNRLLRIQAELTERTQKLNNRFTS